jgi:hypothetical protein
MSSHNVRAGLFSHSTPSHLVTLPAATYICTSMNSLFVRSARSVDHRLHVWKWTRNLLLAAALLTTGSITAQEPQASASPAAANEKGTILLTIFLRHDQSKPLDEINNELRRQGYYKAFPPAGVEVVSWYVMMGIGQVITLRVPAERLRDVNLAIEKTAWGGYRTEFYPTYDYKAIGEAEHAKSQ